MQLRRETNVGVAHLDVDFHAEGLRLAVSVADVEAESVLGGLSFALAVLDVEDAVRAHVLHRERRVGSDDPGTTGRGSWWMKQRTQQRSNRGHFANLWLPTVHSFIINNIYQSKESLEPLKQSFTSLMV